MNHNKEILIIEDILSKVLKIGVILSCIFILFGLFLFIFKLDANEYFNKQHYISIIKILLGVIKFKPYAIIYLGTIFLMLTPFLRVVLSIFIFYTNKDYKFLIISLIILLIILLPIFIFTIL